MKINYFIFSLLFIIALNGCQEEVLPKPKAQLRLEYPRAEYGEFNAGNYRFQMNNFSTVVRKGNGSLNLDYAGMKGSIFITYKKVQDNIGTLMTDAQKLSIEHARKADGILPHPFVNGDDKVYGTYFEVVGDAASQAQFYVTDSTQHFITGSLYFYTKPNYDSILPAASYLQNDVRKIMETIEWNE